MIRWRGNIWQVSRRPSRFYRTLTILHADKRGYCVLQSEASWHTISGLMVNTRWGYVWFMFRNRWSWE